MDPPPLDTPARRSRSGWFRRPRSSFNELPLLPYSAEPVLGRPHVITRDDENTQPTAASSADPIKMPASREMATAIPFTAELFNNVLAVPAAPPSNGYLLEGPEPTPGKLHLQYRRNSSEWCRRPRCPPGVLARGDVAEHSLCEQAVAIRQHWQTHFRRIFAYRTSATHTEPSGMAPRLAREPRHEDQTPARRADLQPILDLIAGSFTPFPQISQPHSQ